MSSNPSLGLSLANKTTALKSEIVSAAPALCIQCIQKKICKNIGEKAVLKIYICTLSEGPSQAKINCKDNGDGSADVDYTPTVQGKNSTRYGRFLPYEKINKQLNFRGLISLFTCF